MKKFLIILTFLLSVSTLTASNDKELAISACGVVRVAFIKELAEGFSKKYNIPISLNKSGGDIKVINDVYKKKVQIGAGCRALFHNGIEKDLDEIQVAWGALAFIVNRDNPIKNITLQQAKDIISGKIKNWKELGWENKPINFYLRKDGNRTGVGYSIRKIILGNENAKLYISSKKVLRKNSDTIRKAILKDKYGFAIGDVMSAKRVKGIKILNLNGVAPTKKNILKQKYLAFRAYFLFFPKKITPLAKKFRDYALSEEGQKIISKVGTANLDEGLASIDEGVAKGDNAIMLFNETKNSELEQNSDNRKELKMYACGITRVAFVKELNRAFSKKYGVTISLNKKGGVPFVLDGLFKKKIDVGSGCRKPFKNKKEGKLWFTQVAWGALGFIVNEKNPINNISTENIKKVLTGRITNWKELGGEDKPIQLYLRRGKDSGVGSSLREILFNDKNKDLYKKASFVKNSGELRRAILKNRYAFGVDDVTSSSKIKGIKILKVDGVEATKENILSQKYTLRRPFFLYMNQKPSGLAKIYVDFALSEEGQAVISKAGTANLKEANGKNDKMNLIFQKLKFHIKSR